MFAVETHNLTKYYKEKLAVNNVNLRINKGSVYALLGPNGAGKTTTIRMLLGIMVPTAGQIKINDLDIIHNPKKIRGEIGILPQNSAAYHDLNAMHNIKFILDLHGIKFKNVKDQLSEYFVQLEITPDLLNKPFSKLSGGEQRAIAFIMAIIIDKPILILDEPTSGLDIARAKYIRAIIKDLAETKNKTILLSSHIVSDLEELATHCGILKNGSLVFQGTKDELVQTYSPETLDFEDAIVESFKTPLAEINNFKEGY